MGIAAQLADLLPDLDEVPEGLVDNAVLASFLRCTDVRGISPHEAQKQA